jgi:nucleoid DNA-binding protein
LNISKYIKELIIKNECIILSGFGGFETHYKPASIDDATGSIVPPSKQVVFRPDFTRDNGVLFNFVARKEGIGLDKAKAIIDDFIGDIVYKLDVAGTFILDGLGTFLKQADGRVIFNPLEKENFLVDSFGLSEISIADKDRPVAQPAAAAQPPQETGKRRTAGILLLVAVITMLLSGAIIVASKTGLFSKVGQLITGSEMPDDETQEKIVFGRKKPQDFGDSINNGLGNKIDQSTDKEKALLYTEQKPEKPAKAEIPRIVHPEGRKQYFIVAGSFQTENHAVDFSEQLNYRGFKPVIIRTDNGLYRVVLDTFEDITLALNGLENYKKKLNSEVWILRN